MEPTWKLTTTLLCIYGFLKELRPSEPYLTEYLIDPRYPNITLQEAYKDVYPVWTYSYLSVLVLVFLVTDFFRYRIVIIIEGLAYVGTWILLLYAKGVAWMQVMQFAYGVASSTEVAYFTYIYAQVDSSHYQIVTSFTRVALLVGRFCSGILGQFLVIMDLTTYRGLNYISLVSVSLSTLVSFCLPKVQMSLYFHRTSSIDNEIREPRNWKMTLKHFKGDVVAAFGNPYILKWSIWWSIGMAGNFQVGNYIQPLWECIAPNGSNEIYNGGVEAFTTFLGALFAFLLGYVKLNWSVYGECVILFCSVLNGLLLIMMGHTDHIWIAYAGYCAFRSLYQMMITIASFEVARNINKDSYGLVFGINTFFALLWQTILTIIVVDDIGFTLPLRKQFYVYGGFWMFCGIAFRISSFIAYLRSYGSTQEPEGH